MTGVMATAWIAIQLFVAEPVRLTVDATALGIVHGPPLAHKLTASTGSALREAGVQLDDRAPRELTIHVRWIDAHAFHYGIVFTSRSSAPESSQGSGATKLADPALEHAFECTDCTMAAVVERVVAELPVITTWFPVDDRPRAPTPTPVVIDIERHAPLRLTKRRMGDLGIAGSVFIGAGAIAIVPGALLVARGERRVYDETGYAGTIHHFDRLGHPILWSGVAVLGVGIVLLTLEFRPERLVKTPKAMHQREIRSNSP